MGLGSMVPGEGLRAACLGVPPEPHPEHRQRQPPLFEGARFHSQCLRSRAQDSEWRSGGLMGLGFGVYGVEILGVCLGVPPEMHPEHRQRQPPLQFGIGFQNNHLHSESCTHEFQR